MLHNDNYNRREYVVKILLKTVEGLTVDDAVNVMQVGDSRGQHVAQQVAQLQLQREGQPGARSANKHCTQGSADSSTLASAVAACSLVVCGPPLWHVATAVVLLHGCVANAAVMAFAALLQYWWLQVLIQTPCLHYCCCFCPLQEAHETGVALVVACAQDTAETYVESLRLNGLISSMEPGH